MQKLEDTVKIQSEAADVAEVEEITYEDGFQVIAANSELLEDLENE